jgi:hypothetical protein
LDLVQIILNFGTTLYVEPIFLPSDGISLFGNTHPFDHVSEDIWKKAFVRIGNKADEAIRIRRFFKSIKHIDSNILKEMPQILKDFETKTWQLLYRGTRDGFGSADFHTKCDKQSNTVTIILTTNGSIFGGFTPIAWDSRSGTKTDDTEKSFLLSLKNPRNGQRTEDFPAVD